ncbi:unnamed protein product [Amoebophrya sp. A120]|nr:unnamed protein product [Amoebophrya sp. A120]|eukprot:GSA120T00010336001.1
MARTWPRARRIHPSLGEADPSKPMAGARASTHKIDGDWRFSPSSGFEVLEHRSIGPGALLLASLWDSVTLAHSFLFSN